MKIALLNLPFDSNFGGNLQRYALITILKRNGYDVEHINLRINFQLPWYKKTFVYSKRILQKLFTNDNQPILLEKYLKKKEDQINQETEIFYAKYIPHTNIITKKAELYKLPHYDAYIVGSDQVWRKKMAKQLGLETYFFDFIDNSNAIKIAYSVSLGSSNNELSQQEIKNLKCLYQKFKAVSVRENSALTLFQKYQWINPQAIQTLDPTMLLTKEDYINLINKGITHPCNGNLFCYILDQNTCKEDIIQKIANQKKLQPFKIQLDGNASIEQWLRSFQDAEYIITDSYHGLVFSIIFQKPFTLIKNEERGNARFDSLLQILRIQPDNLDWNEINFQMNHYRTISLEFIIKNLKSTM